MKTIHRLLLTALPLGLATVLAAQPGSGNGPGQPPRGGRGRPPSPVIRALDTDRNGEISAAEIAAASTSLLTLDTNGDGTLSVDELRPPRPADAPTPPEGAPPPDAARLPHPVPPIMLALDADKDGALSAAEIANAPASLRALDANGDGKLTPDEWRPVPPAGGRGPRGGRPPGE